MKKLVLKLLFLVSTSVFSQEEHLEKASLDCLYEAYFETDVNIKKELEKYEKFLIRHDFLKDSTGKSYIEFFKKVRELKAIHATRPDSLFWKIVKSKFLKNNKRTCILEKLVIGGRLKTIATVDDSKMYNFLLKMNKQQKDSSNIFENFANVVLNNLDEIELERPYYKTMLLMMIAVSGNMEGEAPFLPPPPLEDYKENKN